MRYLLFVFLACIPISYGYAQQCDEAVFMQEGSEFIYTSYNKKGKVTSTAVHKTTKVANKDGKLTATINAISFDKKKKEQFSANYSAYCQNGIFSVDMLRYFDMDKLAEYDDESNIELKIEGSVLSFPSQMKVGDKMEDGTITVKVDNKGFTLVTMTFDISNREIHDYEEITTPAGTFKCQVVTFDFESKFGIIKIKGSGKEWYLDDKVVVKSESYNNKGKLIAYDELTSIN